MVVYLCMCIGVSAFAGGVLFRARVEAAYKGHDRATPPGLRYTYTSRRGIHLVKLPCTTSPYTCTCTGGEVE